MNYTRWLLDSVYGKEVDYTQQIEVDWVEVDYTQSVEVSKVKVSASGLHPVGGNGLHFVGGGWQYSVCRNEVDYT